MTPETLRERVPLFADALELQLASFSGGASLNNSNYKVIADGKEYLLRIGTDSARWLGIRREEEQAAAHAAAEAGVGPALLYGDPEGLMVLPFLAGWHWRPEDAAEPQNMARMAQTLRRLHAVQEADATCSVYERIERLIESAGKLGQEIPAEMNRILNRLDTFRQQRDEDTRFPPGLCHQDLWLNNFLDDGAQLWLVDWEFAGRGDGLYDLATFSMGGGYTPEQQRALLDAYGYTEASDFQTLQEMKDVARCFEGVWGLVQHGLQGSDAYDYLDYSRRTLAALTA